MSRLACAWVYSSVGQACLAILETLTWITAPGESSVLKLEFPAFKVRARICRVLLKVKQAAL